MWKIITLTIGSLLIVFAGGLVYFKSQYHIDGNINNLKGPLIVFDFDGVICDSHEAMLKSFNKVAPDYGLKPLNLEMLEHYRQLSSQAFVDEIGISKLQLPRVVSAIRKDLQDQMKDIPPFKETLKIIHKLKEKGYSMGIVTSNSVENVNRYLNEHQIKGFDFVASAGPFAKDKVFKAIIVASKISPKNIYYVGDETRDIEASRKHNIHSVAASWGYQSSKTLAQMEPDFLIDSPDIILSII